MRKYILLIVLILLIPLTVYSWMGTIVPAGGKNTAVCAAVYSPSVTRDQGVSIGRTANGDFAGYIYKPTANRCVCEVYAINEQEAGDPTGNNYHMRIFTIDGNNDVDAIIGTSAAVAGATIQGLGVGASVGPFTFSPCVNLTSGTEYPLTIFIDTDADLTDNPEEDGINYWRWSYDDERSLDLIQMGRGSWTWDAAIPYADEYVPDAEDDGDFTVYAK